MADGKGCIAPSWQLFSSNRTTTKLNAASGSYFYRAFLVALLIIAAASLGSISISYAETSAPGATKALILVYHRFGPTAADSMTVSMPAFEWQLRYLRDELNDLA